MQSQRLRHCKVRRFVEVLTSDSAEGPVGGSAQAVGGPFDKEGAIGKQFTSEGAVGGAVDATLGEKKDPAGEFTSKGSVGKQFNRMLSPSVLGCKRGANV